MVMGCGGIGGIIAATLVENGYDPLVVTHNAAIAAAIDNRGFAVRSATGLRTVGGRASAEVPAAAGLFDVVLLATPPPQAVAAAQSARAHLSSDGVMVCLQNGLCEPRVAEVIGADRVVGAIVVWGATMPEPGVYERTSPGGFVLGRMDGADDRRFDTLRSLLAPIGPVEITHNLSGARWSKLAINCAISALGTIGGDRLGRLVLWRFVRRLGLELMSEAVAVARQIGVRLERVSGTLDLERIQLTAADRRHRGSLGLLLKHALLLAVGTRYRRMRSSMLLAIERGREPAVDYLNGEVVQRAERLGVPAPINQRAQQLIHAIARREERPGLGLLRRFYEESRAVGEPPPSGRPSAPLGSSAAVAARD